MAQYKTGTVTVTNGSTIVTGDGTEFQTNGVTAGHRWAREGDNVTYTIASVDAEDQITLNEAYQGLTGAGKIYTIGKDVTIHRSYPLLFSGDIETATFISFAFQKIDEDIALSLDGENVAFNSPTGTIAATSVSGAIRELEDDITLLSTGHLVLAGQAGGQQAYGGTGTGDNLTLNSTSHANLGFVMLGGTTGLVYDELNGLIGINESAPLGKLHVRSFDSGTASASVDADELVLENNLNAGLSILSGSSSSGVIAFGDSSNAIIGRIEYSHVSNSMTMYTNSIFAIHIDSSQNVGIGEATPGSPLSSSLSGTFLHVTSASSTRCIIEGGIAYLDLIDNNTTADNGWLSIANSGGSVTFSGLTDTGTTNIASILVMNLSSGYVGIGVAPSAPLHVKDASDTPIICESTDSASIVSIKDNATTGILGPGAAGDTMTFRTNGTVKMYIESDGDVGIGEAVPLGKLHVKTSDAGITANSGADELVIESAGSGGITIGTGTTSNGNIYFADSGGNARGRIVYAHVTDDLIFYTADGQRGWFGNGFIVGSPTGGDKGAGTINAQAVYDDNVLLTDYVFDLYVDGEANKKDKALADNFDIKMFDIEYFSEYWSENRHLPSMPSREEFEKDRMSIGKLAQRLWETSEIHSVHIKTLYDNSYDLEKRIKELETEIAALKAA